MLGWEYDKENKPIKYYYYELNGEKITVNRCTPISNKKDFVSKSVVAGVVIGVLSFIGCRIIGSKIKSKK